MDAMNLVTGAVQHLKKYRLLLLMIAAGVLLLTAPAEKQEKSVPSPVSASSEESSLEDRLCELLSKMDGAGKTAVLLTEAKGEQLLYQTDESSTGTDTVLVTGTTREQSGLLRQRLPPQWQGAVVLCQGADRPEVRLQIVEAVSRATGLTSDRITVLKMK